MNKWVSLKEWFDTEEGKKYFKNITGNLCNNIERDIKELHDKHVEKVSNSWDRKNEN